MNKRVITLSAGVFGFVGAYVPVWIGIDDGFGIWSILGGLFGGIFGIWLAIVLMKRYG